MNSRLMISIAVPATAFALTVAISLWQQRADTSMFAASPALQQAVLPQRREAASTRMEAQISPAPPAEAAPLPSPPPDEGVRDPSRVDVPVGFITRSRQDQSGLLATLLNMTADDLDVRIIRVSAKTHLRSVVDVSLVAHERKNLTQAGLDLDSGDQVTIQSAPYHDRTLQAR